MEYSLELCMVGNCEICLLQITVSQSAVRPISCLSTKLLNNTGYWYPQMEKYWNLRCAVHRLLSDMFYTCIDFWIYYIQKTEFMKKRVFSISDNCNRDEIRKGKSNRQEKQHIKDVKDENVDTQGFVNYYYFFGCRLRWHKNGVSKKLF